MLSLLSFPLSAWGLNVATLWQVANGGAHESKSKADKELEKRKKRRETKKTHKKVFS